MEGQPGLPFCFFAMLEFCSMEISSLVTSLRNTMSSHPRTAFLTGAGISTASGIPDFRGKEGIAYASRHYGMRYESLISHSTLMSKPAVFYDFYWSRMVYPDAKPNAAHLAIAAYRGENAVLTQNIDGLHQKAGSKNVVELHGTTAKYSCLSCGRSYSLSEIRHDGVPHCPSCGGVVRPDVVLYEEPLDYSALEAARDIISSAEVLIVVGTSLNVYPAAGLIYEFRGRTKAIVNLEATPLDSYFDLAIHGPAEEILPEVLG